MPHLIFSLVGAHASGKSYYVCTLLKSLASSLYRNFNIAFGDADPSGNAQLNSMKNQLFSARKPEEAFLLKTAFEGVMYERLPRHGREVALPRPFVYELCPRDCTAGKASIILYDNSGEHFKPNVSLEDSPGALHVASSSAILLLIDPTTLPSMRRRLAGYADPQLTIDLIDEQDTLISEMAVRIRSVAGLSAREKVKTPIALILGKCDVWQHLLPGPALESPLSQAGLDLRKLDEISDRIREFLLEVETPLVAISESIAENVRFFPASSFGHSPVILNSGPNAGKFAPDPAQLQPRFVEIPFLWALHHALPGFLKTTT